MTYLNAGWAGPSPATVIERMREAADKESAGGPAGPEGVSPEDILLTHGTSEGVNIAIGGLAWEPGDTLLISSLEHPGIKTPSALLGDRRGVNIRTVNLSPYASADECLSAFRAALSGSVKLVTLSHVMYTCGLRIPAKEIVDAAHDAGALGTSLSTSRQWKLISTPRPARSGSGGPAALVRSTSAQTDEMH
jgi:hypothetical protein